MDKSINDFYKTDNQNEFEISEGLLDNYKRELKLCANAGGDVHKILIKKLDFEQLVEVRKGLESGVDVSRYFSSSVSAKMMEELRLEMEQHIDMTSYRKEGYNLLQTYEIREGKFKNLDVSQYENKDYDAMQMREIRLGIEEELPIIFYKDKKFSWMQMQEIRLGLLENIDISAYAKYKIPFNKMRVVREAMMDGMLYKDYEITNLSSGVLGAMHNAFVRKIDISEYINEGFDEEQLEEIIIAKEEKIDIDRYIKSSFRGQSIAEIRLGLESGVDVTKYATDDFNWMQMRELRLGLEHKVNILTYLKPLYQAEQMREIRLGLESGVDISKYSSMVNTPKFMRLIRQKLEKGEDVSDFLQVKRTNHVQSDATIIKTFDGTTKEKIRYLKVSDDGLEAYLRLPIIKDTSIYTYEFVKEILGKAGITYGIQKTLIEAMLNSGRFDEDMLVARGQMAVDGKDGYYEYFFDNNLPAAPLYEEDGSINFFNIKFFENVKAGDKIAKYHPAIPATDGYTVKGDIIYGKKGKDMQKLNGRGFMLMDDKKTYIAALTGSLKSNGYEINIDSLNVLDEKNLKKDVNYPGSIHIKGDVHAGTRIEARGDVIIDKMAERTNIVAGGNVVFRMGANGLEDRADIKADGNIYAGYLRNLDITVKGNIYANEIVDCNIHCQGMVKTFGDSGTIMGGNVVTRYGIETTFLGSDGGMRTIACIEPSKELEKEYDSINSKLSEVKEQLNIFYKQKKKIDNLTEEEKQKNTQFRIKVKTAITLKEKELDELNIKKKECEDNMTLGKEAKILVKDTVYAGTIIVVEDMTMPISRNRAYKENGNIIFQK